MSPRQRHPDKKKHANRPRSELPQPLAESERATRGQEEYDKACIHLREAEILAHLSKTPNACIHSAYYAMYHTAAAVLYATGGVGKRRDVPKSHEHVIEHFGKLVALETEELSSLGRLLNAARNDRMVADYDMVRGAENLDAQATTKDARHFVDLCSQRWNLHSNALDELDD